MYNDYFAKIDILFMNDYIYRQIQENFSDGVQLYLSGKYKKHLKPFYGLSSLALQWI